MHRRAWAQKFFRLLIFLVSACPALVGGVVLFVDGGLIIPAAAQEPSPTPASPIPLQGTQTVIPEIPTPSPVSITYPVHGIKLTGVVNVTGLILLEGWSSYELSFSYVDDATGSWFPFAGGRNPLATDVLAAWDTTTLSDGDYNLRLRVITGTGSFQDAIVYTYGLRIRNYTADTPVPTLTLTPTATSAATALPTFTPTVTSTVYPTPTQLPPNPATLDNDQIVFSLGGGALLAALVSGLLGFFVYMRRK
jgi:hypothetical protein